MAHEEVKEKLQEIFNRKEAITVKEWSVLKSLLDTPSLPVSSKSNEGAEWIKDQEDTYYDLSHFSEEEKAEFLKQMGLSVGKALMKTFLSLGLKSHIHQMFKNDDKEYILRFDTLESFDMQFPTNRLSAPMDNNFNKNDIETAINFGFDKCKQFGDITKPEMESFINGLPKHTLSTPISKEKVSDEEIKRMALELFPKKMSPTLSVDYNHEARVHFITGIKKGLSLIPDAKEKETWYKPSHRPDYNKEDNRFSKMVLMYSPEMDVHTIGWFEFDTEKWKHIADEDFELDFVWTELTKPKQ